MHPFHRLPDAAIAASWALLLGVVGVDALASAGGAFAPPNGVRALAVTFVICVTVARVANRTVSRLAAIMSENRRLLEELRAEQRELIAIGEHIGEHRALHLHGHPVLSPHPSPRPHRPQARFDRETGWVS